MRILVDTNIILDVLLKREAFYQSGKSVLELTEYAEFDEYVSASAVTDIYYIVRRTLKDAAAARKALKHLFEVVNVAGVSAQDIQRALDMPWDDFEDAVQYSAALSAKLDAVITRDKNGYRSAQIPVYHPEEFLTLVNSK